MLGLSVYKSLRPLTLWINYHGLCGTEVKNYQVRVHALGYNAVTFLRQAAVSVLTKGHIRSATNREIDT